MQAPRMSKYFYEPPQAKAERDPPLPSREADTVIRTYRKQQRETFPFTSHRTVEEAWRWHGWWS
jgi:hypothetical protein